MRKQTAETKNNKDNGTQYDNRRTMEVIYNIGDAINKIGFGLVVYTFAFEDKKI